MTQRCQAIFSETRIKNDISINFAFSIFFGFVAFTIFLACLLDIAKKQNEILKILKEKQVEIKE